MMIFSDKKIANDVIDFLKQKEGFKKHPDDFIIDEIMLNDHHWCSGFG